MARKQSVEERLIAHFTTAPIAEAEKLLTTATAIVRARSPKAPRKKATKAAPPAILERQG